MDPAAKSHSRMDVRRAHLVTTTCISRDGRSLTCGHTHAYFSYPHADAETLWQTTVTRNPQSWMAYNNFSKLKLEQGWYGYALLYSQLAAMLKPDDAIVNNNLGQALRANQQLDQAIVSFKKASAIRPEVASFHGDLANALEEAGKVREAVSQYELALGIEPSDVRLSNNLAWTLATNRDPTIRNGSKAVKYAEIAVKLAGGAEPTTTATLAAAYAEAGRFAEAVTTAERAHSLALSLHGERQAAQIAGLQQLYLRRPAVSCRVEGVLGLG